MNKIFSIFLIFFLMLGLIFSDVADAKSRGGSFSSFRSSKSVIKTVKPQSSRTFNSSNNSKSGSFGKTAPTVMKSKNNEIDLNKYKKSGNPIKTKSYSVKKYKPKDDDGYRYYTNPPTYVYQTYPSFGMWDTIFLMYLLDNNNEWFYHHQNDEGVKAFKDELEEMSKENSELKEKYANLELKLQEMENSNVKIDQEYKSESFEEESFLNRLQNKSFFESLFE